jgi:outer membrane receptor protein involved in Fe transport
MDLCLSVESLKARTLGLMGIAAFSLMLISRTVCASASDPGTSVDSDTQLEEISVTAQRREERLQDVPISMTAITGSTLQAFGDTKFDDFSGLIPNLAVGTGNGDGGYGTGQGVSSSRGIAIRGISGNNTTGFYLDDTPVPISLDPRALDIDHIEVLRGPQGTLFGGGSMGGTVRLVSRAPVPNQFSGDVDVQGSYVDRGGAGYSATSTLNVPVIADIATLRISGFSGFDPGVFTRRYGGTQSPLSPSVPFPPGGATPGQKDNVGGEHDAGVIATLAITPGVPGLTITPMAILQNQSRNGYPTADYSPNNFVQIRPLNVAESVNDTWSFAGLTLKQETSFGRFVAYGTYFYRSASDEEDTTDVSALVFYDLPYYVASPLDTTITTKTWTGEARFESAIPGPVQFVAGVFDSLSERLFYQYWNVPGANVASGGSLGTDLVYTQGSPNADRQRAAFIDATYQITDAFQVSAGVRTAYLARAGAYIANGPLNGGYSNDYSAHDERDSAPRFTAKYQLAPNQVIYASAAKGFRTGGINSLLPDICDADLAKLGQSNGSPFNSDSIWSFELGSKNSYLNGRVQSRVAIYRIDWKNIQQFIQLACTFPIVANSGAAVSKGAELEVDALPIEHLLLHVSAGYEDAAITEANPASSTAVGQPLQDVPRWTGSALADYSVPFGDRVGFLRAQWSYVGSRTSFNNVPPPIGLPLSPYSQLNLLTGFHQGQWETSFAVRNVANKIGEVGDLLSEGAQLPGRTRYFVTRPRTVVLEVKRKF